MERCRIEGHRCIAPAVVRSRLRAADPVRRTRAGVPEDVVFKTKPQNRARWDPGRERRGSAGGNRFGGCRLRGQHSVSNGADLHGPELCRRRSIVGAALAAGSGSAPAQGTERARPAANADAARRTSLNRPSNSPSRCWPTRGMTSHGARASTKRCVPVSPSYAFGPRIGTTGTRNPSLFSRSPSRILIERRRFWFSLGAVLLDDVHCRVQN
jgi:hypothetical protein